MDRLTGAQKIGYFWVFIMGFTLGIALGFTGSAWITERDAVTAGPQ